MRRILSLLLSAALLAALLLPAGAAESSFPDISDPETAVEADILRLMGVVNGTGDGLFHPEGTLTRAEFCAMAIRFMGKEDLVPRHTARTIFSDVTARHWALGYVNLAASLPVAEAGEGETPLCLVAGVGNGKFEPDSRITLAQAATILLRVLGYSDEQAGAVWPQGYLNLARSTGLLDGITVGSGDPIPRAQAARLFVNALSCRKESGEVYYKSLENTTVADKTVILAVNVETDTGDALGAIRTASGQGVRSYLPAAEGVVPTALRGRRGALVLNERQEIVTFIPDDSEAVTLVLTGDAHPSYLSGAGGRRYTVDPDTKVYTASGQEDTYLKACGTLHSGASVTLYLERGKVAAIFTEGGAEAGSGGAVVVMGTPSAAMFQGITGGASGYRVQKNRQTIALSQLKPYDVVTYDSMTNTLVASDLRLVCVYEDASPNPKAPTRIKVLGCSFEVLDSAWAMTESFKVGDQVALLLTADGRVAGMAKAGTGGLRSTAMGEVTSETTAELFLPNGGTLKLEGAISNAKDRMDQLVTLSSGKRGQLSASRIASRTAPGEFSAERMTLGQYTVAAGVRVYEQVKGGAMVAVNLDSLEEGVVPANKVTAYQLNSSDMVNYIVLQDTTGNAYDYGAMISNTVTEGEGEDAVTITTWKLIRGGDKAVEFAPQYSYSGRNGDFVGVAVGLNRNGENRILSVLQLSKFEHLSPADFFESGGVSYVRANGRTYRVADDVECLRNIGSRRVTEDSWFTQDSGAERLAACTAFSGDLTAYIDPVGQRVRVVQAN